MCRDGKGRVEAGRWEGLDRKHNSLGLEPVCAGYCRRTEF